jgi:exodeoxyribonuclease III
MKLLSWNVNGVRAAHGKGLLDWMAASRADVIFLQEVKALEADVEHIVWPAGYERAWNAAEKKGYSGTALFSRTKPLSVVRGIGSAAHDAEGRAITAEFPDCYVVGVYVPNAQPELGCDRECGAFRLEGQHDGDVSQRLRNDGERVGAAGVARRCGQRARAGRRRELPELA